MNQNTLPIPKHPRRSRTPFKDSLTQTEPAWDQNFHYRALFEQMEDCVFIISFDLRYIAVNPQAIHLLGYTEQELIGKPVSEIMYQDAPSGTENVLGNTSNLFERLMRCKDGSILPVEILTSIVYNQDGSPAYVQTIARDIAERKAAEQSLKYRNLILAVINNAAEQLLRSSNIQEEIPEILQLLGRTTNLARCAIIQARDRDRFENGIDICFEWQNPAAPQIDLQTITRYLSLNRRANSRDFFMDAGAFAKDSVDFSPVPLAFIRIFEGDRAWGFVGLLAPVTQPKWDPVQREAIRTAANIIGAALQRQYTEEKIHASEEHSRAILAALPDLIIRVDQSGNILDYSARKDHPLYMQRETVNGKKLSEIWNGDISRQIATVTGDTFLVSAHIRKEFSIPGSNNIYEAHLDPISAAETLIVIRDISDQARLNQMKSDFINRASHELRTPLTTAILMCDLLQGDGDPAEKVEYWQILNNELNRQKSLIDRLLMAGRLESGKLTLEPEALDVIPILEESVLAIKPVAKKKNIAIKTSGLSAPLMVWGDKSGLQQVFINLINNAAKFSPPGSFVAIHVSKEIDKVHIAISDQGLGIPPEAMPNLFEQFFRARNVTLAEIPGSGVGLYIVKSIIDELKGEIKVESEINQGTTFIITLNAMR
ncbi:MAG: PAS domain S-box protein [Anaerolineales bacterium]